MTENNTQQPTGPEPLHRVGLANTLIICGMAMWFAPIALLGMPHNSAAFVIAVNLLSAFGLAATATGIAMRFVHRYQVRRRARDEAEQRRHQELVAAQKADRAAWEADRVALVRLFEHNQKVTDAALRDMRNQVRAIVGKLDRGAWDIYADAQADMRGGPEAVNGEITHQLNYGPVHGYESNVLPMRRSAPRN